MPQSCVKERSTYFVETKLVMLLNKQVYKKKKTGPEKKNGGE